MTQFFLCDPKSKGCKNTGNIVLCDKKKLCDRKSVTQHFFCVTQNPKRHKNTKQNVKNHKKYQKFAQKAKCIKTQKKLKTQKHKTTQKR